MADPISIAGTLIALLLPWIFGYACVSCLLARSPRRNHFIIAGHGYLVGIVLTTLIIRLWDFVGLPLHYWGLVATISALSIGAFFVSHRSPSTTTLQTESPPLEKWQIAVVTLLLLLIVYRYGDIAQEILLRPLYPWDAWMNWAPKALTWYHLGELAPYVSPEEWLRNGEETALHTAGARNAWKYPVTVPLIQLWGMLGAGSADQTVSNLPWLFAPLAFGLALYGHLRLIGASALLATTASYIFLSIPYVSVHTALAGYADLWLAVTFGAGVLSLHEWQQARQRPWAALVLFFAFACTQLKLPGLVLGAIIFFLFMSTLLGSRKKLRLTLALLAAAFLLSVLFVGISLNVPNVGLIELSAKQISLPYLGTYQLAYQAVHSALIDTIFYMVNWNILWFLFFGLLLFKLFKKDFMQPASIELQAIAPLLLFLLFIFYFTHFSEFVLDYSTVNRALLYAVPAMVFYLFRSIYLWRSGSRQ